MAAGLFELRKDAITGWWVATVVDRTFHRDRFRMAAAEVDDGGDCQNCREPGELSDAELRALEYSQRLARRVRNVSASEASPDVATNLWQGACAGGA